MPESTLIPRRIRHLHDWPGIGDGQLLKRSGTDVVGLPATSLVAPYPPQLPVTGTPPAPLDLTFREVSRNRIVEPLDENFVVFSETFSSFSTERYAGGGLNPDPRATGGTINTVAGVTLQLTATETRLKVPFASVVAKVVSWSGDATLDVVGGGFSNINGDYIRGFYNKGTQFCYFTISVGGVVSDGLSTVGPFDVAAGSEIAVNIADRAVSLWIREPGKSWRLVNQYNAGALLDMRPAATLANTHPFLFVRSNSGSISVSNWRFGYGGQVGWLGQKIVTYEDGTPMIEDNKVYFSSAAPCRAGDNSRDLGVPATYTGVWRMDLTTYAIESLSIICFQRPGAAGLNAGLVMGDNGGPLIYDRPSNQWIMLAGTWGDDGGIGSGAGGPGYNIVQTYRYLSKANLLSGVHVLSSSTALAPPTYLGSGDVYDPFPVKMADGLWHLGYSTAGPDRSSWWPAQATTPDLTAATPVFTGVGTIDTAHGKSEGPNYVRINGDWTCWFTCSDNVGFWHIYDVESHVYLGAIANLAPISSHPTILTYNDGDVTRMLAMLFDGEAFAGFTYSWGNHIVLMADQTWNGNEFDRARVPHW